MAPLRSGDDGLAASGARAADTATKQLNLWRDAHDLARLRQRSAGSEPRREGSALVPNIG